MDQRIYVSMLVSAAGLRHLIRQARAETEWIGTLLFGAALGWVAVTVVADGLEGGAVLDTFREEPLPALSSFYELPNVIVTPHTAWSSGRVLDRSVDLFCDNLRRFATGEPLLNVVDPAAGY